MNRIDELFRRKKKNVLSVFFTAGYPSLDDTPEILEALDSAGVDLVEIGMPFSDPVADGPVIQDSSMQALKNGMSLEVLFGQLAVCRPRVKIPVVLMGYINPVLQYGIARFFKDAERVGVDGVILPDLPPEEYLEQVKPLAEKTGITVIFLVTPLTPDERVRMLDSLSKGFLYAVSSSAITGATLNVNETRRAYFRRLAGLGLTNPVLVGFGISDRKAFEEVCTALSGAVIGSAFIKAVGGAKDVRTAARQFVAGIRE